MQRILNFINGEYVAPVSNQYLEGYNPAIGAVYSEVPDSDERDVNLAVKAASEAFEVWSNYTQEQRSDILLKIAQGIERRLEEFALAETNEEFSNSR